MSGGGDADAAEAPERTRSPGSAEPSRPERAAGPATDPGPDEPVRLPVDGVLDLHTFHPSDVEDLVNDYLDACREVGIREVRIIHGKGKGVQRERVHSVLRQRDDVGGFRLAGDASGWGATLVRLAGLLLALLVAAAPPGCGPTASPDADVPATAGEEPGGGDEAAETGAESPSGDAAAAGRGAGPRGAAHGEPEAISFLGRELWAPELPPERRAEYEDNLEEAREAWSEDPDDEERLVWYGRRTAYLGRYREAIEIYTEGLERHPDSWKLRRHRGHRYITVREPERAETDLEEAARLLEGVEPETEPDGIPNRLNRPLTTGHFNVWYHLALARYLQADFEGAATAWRRCLDFSGNPDTLVATSDWLWLTERRLGRNEAAARLLEPIHADLEIIENDSYLRRLLLYRGQLGPEEVLDPDAVDDSSLADDPDAALQVATQGYGVGTWYLLGGDRARAGEIYRAVVGSPSWAAFGFLAAEAQLARWAR